MTSSFDWNSYQESSNAPKEEETFDWGKFETRPEKAERLYPTSPGEKARTDMEYEAGQRLNQPGAPTSFMDTYRDISALTDDSDYNVYPSAGQTREAGKAALSGATFGVTELIPGMQPDRETLPGVTMAGEVAGSFAPIEATLQGLKWASKPIYNLAAKSPIASKAITSLLDVFNMGAAGATYKGLQDAFKGEVPSADDLIEHGAEWAALDVALKALGKGGQFVSWLAGKAKGAGRSSFAELNEFLTANKEQFSTPERATMKVLSILEEGAPKPSGKQITLSKKQPGEVETLAQKTLKEIEAMPESLAGKKVTQENFDLIGRKSDLNAKDYLPGEIISEDIQKSIAKNAEKESIEAFAPRAANEQELGSIVQRDIDKGLTEAKEKVKPLYQQVDKTASKIMHSPKTSIALTEDILSELNALKTKPAGYKQVIGYLEDALQDMGYGVELVENELVLSKSGKPLIKSKSGKVVPAKGKAPKAQKILQKVPVFEDVPLSKLLELQRRLSKIVDFDLVGGSIKDKLKPVGGQLKEEFRNVLKSVDENAYKTLQKADAQYASDANRFGRENIYNMRKAEAPEKIARLLESPTGLQDLRGAISKESFSKIEREILERLQAMKLNKASKTYRNISHQLSPEAKKIAKDIVTSKIPSKKVVPSQSEKLKGDFVKGLNKDIIQGKRPENALDLWKTEKGQRFIKDALKGNPNAEKVLQYLERQSLFDFAKSVVGKDGKIDFKKFKEFMSDPATRVNLELVGGKQAVDFFDKLGAFSEKIDKNLRIRNVLPIDKIPKPETPQGEALLQRAANKAKQPIKSVEIAGEKLETGVKRQFEKGEKGKLLKPERGAQKLKKMARGEAPVAFKLRDLYADLPDPVKMMSHLFGMITYGPFKAIGANVAWNAIVKLATKPKLRSDMIKIMNLSKTNPVDALAELEKLGRALLASETSDKGNK